MWSRTFSLFSPDLWDKVVIQSIYHTAFVNRVPIPSGKSEKIILLFSSRGKVREL